MLWRSIRSRISYCIIPIRLKHSFVFAIINSTAYNILCGGKTCFNYDDFFQQFLAVLKVFWKKIMIDNFCHWQFNTCVCLEKIPGQRSRGSKNCSSTCSWNYPTGTNITFQNYCGGHKTYSLFKSGTIFAWQTTEFL